MLSITLNTATACGMADGNGVTEKGLCWSKSKNPDIHSDKTMHGPGIGYFSGTLTNLLPKTTYFMRAYATGKAGTVYGEELSFITSETILPVVDTRIPYSVSQTSAACSAFIFKEGNASLVAGGICWNVHPNPTTENSKTTVDLANATAPVFLSDITGLNPNTKYYLRAYVTTPYGTTYGNEVAFTTYLGVVTDYDGNTYNTVKIGTQEWMVENLKVQHYRNGAPIQLVSDSLPWISAPGGAYCYYNNKQKNADAFGYLYNWYAVNDSRNLAPAGWHVPTKADWEKFHKAIGFEARKIMGATHWQYGAPANCNETSFTGLPAGIRDETGHYAHMGINTRFWSGTASSANTAYSYLLIQNNSIMNSNSAAAGLSIRCVKD